MLGRAGLRAGPSEGPVLPIGDLGITSSPRRSSDSGTDLGSGVPSVLLNLRPKSITAGLLRSFRLGHWSALRSVPDLRFMLGH